MLRSQVMLPLFVCASCVLVGCPGDDPVDPPAATDTGSVPAPPDAGNTASNDAGGNIRIDAGFVGADTGMAAQRVVPSRSITGGGGSGQNEDYKVRVIIGGPTAAGRGASELNKVQVGAGAAQKSP